MRNSLYELHLKNSAMLADDESTRERWHKKLTHLSMTKMKQLEDIKGMKRSTNKIQDKHVKPVRRPNKQHFYSLVSLTEPQDH